MVSPSSMALYVSVFRADQFIHTDDLTFLPSLPTPYVRSIITCYLEQSIKIPTYSSRPTGVAAC